MLCPEARRDVYSFLDAELDSDRRRAIEAHLTACSPCRDYVASLDGVEQAIQSEHRAVTAPESLRARIRVELERDARWGGRSRRMTGAATVAALALGALFVTFGPQKPIDAAPPAMQEMIRIHGALARGTRAMPCTDRALDKVRAFLGCRCKFKVCTHDLEAIGLMLAGADTAEMEADPGTTMAFTPYVHTDGRRVTHFSVAAKCLELDKVPGSRQLEHGALRYHVADTAGYRVVLIPHGDELCVFIFPLEGAMETVVVAALAG